MRPLAWILLPLAAFADDAALLRRELARERAALAERCGKEGLVEEAARELGAARREDPGVGDGRPDKPWVVSWDDARQAAFEAYAKDRDAMLRRFADRWLALGDARAAVRLCPDHAAARDRLGEVFAGGAWVPKADADRMLQDLLPIGGRWLPAEEVRKRRSAWAEAWEVRSERFLVRSNRSEAAAREVLALAETVFAAVHRELEGELDPPAPKKLLAVYDFATRADLLAHLESAHAGGPDHRGSAGFFSSSDGASHFAPAGDGFGLSDDDVRRHEIAHQVCDAMWPPQGMLGERPHFWAWEGIAAYFESIEVRAGKILTGARRHPRLDIARRALEAGETLPLEAYVRLDADGVKGRYNQGASLAHFFLHADGAAHREAFLKYLRVVASGKAEAGTFEAAFGKKPSEFQEAWEAWVRGAR